MLHIEKTRSRPALPPLLRGSDASYLTKILTLIPYLLTASSFDPLLPALSSTLLPFSFSLQPLFSYLLSPPLPPLFFLFLSTIRYIICFSHFSAITQKRHLHSYLTKILTLIPYLLTASSFDPLLPALSSTLLPFSFSLQPLFSYLLSPPLPPLFFLFLSTIRYIICFSHFSATTY